MTGLESKELIKEVGCVKLEKTNFLEVAEGRDLTIKGITISVNTSHDNDIVAVSSNNLIVSIKSLKNAKVSVNIHSAIGTVSVLVKEGRRLVVLGNANCVTQEELDFIRLCCEELNIKHS